jgi:hypothetical protein
MFTLLATLAGTATTASAAAADELEHCVLSETSDEVTCYPTEREAKGTAAVLHLVFGAWDDVRYSGYGRLYYATTPCTVPYDNERNKKAATIHPRLNNDITSWQTVGECAVRFYDPPNFGTPMSPLSYVGIDCEDMRTCFGSVNWNNRASSFALT